MTDAEIDALAREVLTKASDLVTSWDSASYVIAQEMDDGEKLVTYQGEREGYGAYSCDYFVFHAIKQIVADCEQFFHDFHIEITNKDTGEATKVKVSEKLPEEARDSLVKFMAETASVHMVASFQAKIQETLEESLEDGRLIAKTILQSIVAGQMRELKFDGVVADMRSEIEESVGRVAATKRKALIGLIARLPHALAERGRGRIPKSESEREQDRRNYIREVEDAYKRLRNDLGRKPSKTQVATALGEGGINPKTGSDTRLNAFNLKLKRLKIDYIEIAQKIEDELQQ